MSIRISSSGSLDTGHTGTGAPLVPGCTEPGLWAPQRGGFIPPRGWFYPPNGSFGGGGGYCPFGVVLSPLFSGFIPPLSPFWGQRGMAHLYVNLEPQYRNTSSGMEVEEVLEGEGTTYGFTLSVLVQIALCYMCYRMPDLVGDNFTNGV